MLDEKKKTIIIAGSVVLLLLISLALVLFSPKTYVVEFNDGVKTYSIAVKKNEQLYKPSVPSKEGYVFLGWYKDGSLYDFSSEVKEDFELVAKFQKEGQEEVEMPEETTTTMKEETTTTTTKKNETTKKNTTTKKVTTNAPVVTTAPTTAAPTTTTRPTTTVAPTTTTKAVTYSVVRVDVANSTIGQQMIYVKNNSTGAYVAGTVTITYTAGNSATVSVPAGGLMVVKSTIASVSNPRGN